MKLFKTFKTPKTEAYENIIYKIIHLCFSPSYFKQRIHSYQQFFQTHLSGRPGIL